MLILLYFNVQPLYLNIFNSIIFYLNNSKYRNIPKLLMYNNKIDTCNICYDETKVLVNISSKYNSTCKYCTFTCCSICYINFYKNKCHICKKFDHF